MRLSLTTAIATATLFANSIAAPTARSADLRSTPELEKKSIERRDDTKYFHEPGGDLTLGHYDKRYFHEIVSDEERTDTQQHMIRAYLEFFRTNNLDTWIAHGTLLGWWWNGKRLPWDFDLDTQVSSATLQHLGEKYNQTMYQYSSTDGQTHRQFLLDVNPWIWQRERGDGMNIIDARWIDVRNGLFIDITGLAETHPGDQPGVWSCKNYHRYHTTELYPMRETMFEGVVAKVPYSYDKILVDEYKVSALINTDFNGHRWDPNVKEWKKTPETLRKEEEDRKRKEDEERKKKEDEERKKEEEERKKKEDEERKQKEEEDKKKKEQEDRQKAEGDRQRAEAERQQEEAQKLAEQAQLE